MVIVIVKETNNVFRRRNVGGKIKKITQKLVLNSHYKLSLIYT